MKKIFALAAMAACVFAFSACDQNDPEVDAGEDIVNSTVEKGIVVLNELDGQNKYIELYNTSDKEASLTGLKIVKFDSTKDGGKSTTWTGAPNMVIPAKGYVVLESSDLADPAEKGDPSYKYESDNHIFKGGLSPKKNVLIKLFRADDLELDEFKRGEEGAGWNQVKGYPENEECSFSRVPDGTGAFVYAAPTKKAANGTKVADIEQAPAQ